jgi:copper chaperone NosL
VAGGLILLSVASCGGGVPQPAVLDPRNDTCAYCRMAVSVQRLAAQIVAPSEEPKFFDDIGCLRDYLRQHPALAPGSVAYVADHRTGEWVAASRAVFTRGRAVQTPMASGLVAHRDAASRDQDGAAVGGSEVAAAALLGPLATGAPR